MSDPRDARGGLLTLEPGTGNPWLRAARFGLADPVLAGAARECFAIS